MASPCFSKAFFSPPASRWTGHDYWLTLSRPPDRTLTFRNKKICCWPLSPFFFQVYTPPPSSGTLYPYFFEPPPPLSARFSFFSVPPCRLSACSSPSTTRDSTFAHSDPLLPNLLPKPRSLCPTIPPPPIHGSLFDLLATPPGLDLLTPSPRHPPPPPFAHFLLFPITFAVDVDLPL